MGASTSWLACGTAEIADLLLKLWRREVDAGDNGAHSALGGQSAVHTDMNTAPLMRGFKLSVGGGRQDGREILLVLCTIL